MLAQVLGAAVTKSAAAPGVRRALAAGGSTLNELPAVVAALASASSSGAGLLGATALAKAKVASWFEWAEAQPEAGAQDVTPVDAALTASSYVAGNSFTIADALVGYLIKPIVATKPTPAIARWLDQISHESAALAGLAPEGFTRTPAPVGEKAGKKDKAAKKAEGGAAAAPAAAGGGGGGGKKEEAEPSIESDPIAVCDLRVGVILKAWEHPESDKLWCEEIDLGEATGPRSIGSGLRAHFSQEQMTGQRVIVFANLQARKLAGFPSNGMVLCATAADGRVEFVEPPAAAAIGERVVFPGHEGKAASPNQMAKKKVFELVAPDLAVSDDCVATWKGVPFMTSAGPCIVKTAKNGPIK